MKRSANLLSKMFLTSLLVSACGEVQSEVSHVSTICGQTNDLQDVAFYNGEFSGLERDFVMSNQGPVGALTNQSGRAFCSGTLIGINTFLTAAHCLNSNPMFVAFNYQLDEQGNMADRDSYRVTSVIEKSNGGLDYAILRLEGEPGTIWGFTQLADSVPSRGSQVTVIQHPAGQPKKVHTGPVVSVSNSRLSYSLDTLGGSSGSGVLDQDGKLVAVHTNGGCTASGGANLGVRIDSIRNVSQVIGF